MQIEFVPEGIKFSISLAKYKWAVVDGRPRPVKVGNEVTQDFYLMADVDEEGRLITLGERIDDAIKEAVEVAEEREAGG